MRTRITRERILRVAAPGVVGLALAVAAGGAASALTSPGIWPTIAVAPAATTPAPAIPTPDPNPPLRTPVPAGAPTPEVLPAQTPVAVAQPVPTALPVDDASIKLWYDAGVALRGADAQGNDIVAQIDGIDVRRKEIAFLQTLNAGSNRTSPTKLPTDNRGVLLSKVRTAAVNAEALRRGLQPTDSELNEFIDELRAKLHSNPQSALELGAFLSGLQQTEDAYFASAEVRATYARQLAATKMQTREVGALGQDQRQAAWDLVAERLEAAAKVTILDPAFR